MKAFLVYLDNAMSRIELAYTEATSWMHRGPLARLGIWWRWVLPFGLIGVWIVGIAGTGRMPVGDGPHIMGGGMRLAQYFQDLDFWTAFLCFQSSVGPHPPMAYFPSALAYSLGGVSTDWAHLLGGGLVLWLIWDGLHRFGAGLVGAFFCVSAGVVWVQAEGSGVDLMASACVIQSLSHLVKSERLKNRKHVVLWGVWMGLGFLCKYTAPVFMAAPCLVAGWWVLRDRKWTQFILAFGAFMAVAGIWYLVHAEGVMGYIGQSQGADEQTRSLMTNKALVENPWAPGEVLWYPAVFLDTWGWPGALCVLLGLLVWGRRKNLPEGTWLIPLLGVAVGVLVLMGQSQRQGRYLLPALPLLAVLVGTCRLRWLMAPVGLIGAWCTATVFFQTNDAPDSRLYEHTWEDAGSDWPWVHPAFMPASMDPEDWRMAHAVDRIRHFQESDVGTVAFLTDETGGGPGSGLLLTQANRLEQKWDIASISIGAPPNGGGAIIGVPHMSPFLLDGILADEWPSRWFTVVFAMIEPDDSTRLAWLEQESMILQESWPLPNGREGRIYTRPADAVRPMAPEGTEGI